MTTALSHIRLDDGPNGMRGDFERAVAFLLPTDPVKKRGGRTKRNSAQISSTQGSDRGAGGNKTKRPKEKKVKFKPNVGKTGVEFYYYKSKEFLKLTQEQKNELITHRNANGFTKGVGGGQKSGITRAGVSAIIKEQLADKEKERKDAEAVGASVSSMVQELKGLVESSVAAKSARSSQKRVQRAGGATVASVETDAMAVEALEAEAERAASKLMLRFSKIGSKAGKRG